MKDFFKREIQEKITINRIFIESLIYAAFITGIAIYGITLFADPNMQEFAQAVKKEPISIYFMLLPAIIVLVETITIGLAVMKMPAKKKISKKTSKKKSEK